MIKNRLYFRSCSQISFIFSILVCLQLSACDHCPSLVIWETLKPQRVPFCFFYNGSQTEYFLKKWEEQFLDPQFAINKMWCHYFIQCRNKLLNNEFCNLSITIICQSHSLGSALTHNPSCYWDPNTGSK